LPQELADAPPIPAEMSALWGWFLELSAARPGAFSGVSPITFEAIEAWARLTGARPRPEEVRLIRKLDDLYREVIAEKEQR
jgi:hypothetical protein